jgi:hypothetical protein
MRRRTGELLLAAALLAPAIAAGATRTPRSSEPRLALAAAPPTTAPARGRATWRGWERDVALRVEVDRREAWLGQQITASVWLLSPVPVDGYHAYRPPLYDGFWTEVIDTPQSIAGEVRTVGGVPVRAYLVQRIALFPTRAGALALGPFELDAEVRLGGGAFDPFPEHRRVRRRSEAVALRVKPLPPGAPPGFEPVNVGKIALSAELPARKVAVGDAAPVRLVATGEGNVRAWSLPALPALAAARAYAPVPGERLEPKGGRIRGARTVETTIVPERAGEVVIPPVAWSWFDPGAGVYRVARTGELRLEVVPASAADSAGAPALEEVLRPIRPRSALVRRGPPPWETPLFAAAMVLPVLAFAALAAADRIRARLRAQRGSRRARGAGRAALRRLARAERLARRGERDASLAEAERALLGWASDRLGRSASGLTRDALARALSGTGAPAPAVRALAAALDACDAARFGGDGASDAEVLAAAARAVRVLEEPAR